MASFRRSSSLLWVISLRAGLLFAGLGLVAWGTGRPFIFPSLGPTAFVLSMQPKGALASAWEVIGSHTWGTAAGLVSYHLLASGATMSALQGAEAAAGLALTASGTLAMMLTTALLIGTRATHPPACATTLIVSLGLMPTLLDGAIIVAAVVVLYGLARALRRYDRLLGTKS